MSDNSAPDSPAAMLERAIGFHNEGKVGEAAALYQKFLEIEPRNPEALHLLGLTYHQCGQHEEAIEMISQAIEIRPTECSYYSNLGAAYKRAERIPEAIEVLEKAIQIDENFLPAIYNVGEAYSLADRFEDAVRTYRRVLEMSPGLPEAWNNLGICLMRLGLEDDSEEAYLKALELQPDMALALYGLATLRRNQGRVDEARAYYSQSMNLGFDQVACLSNLVDISLGQDLPDEALNYLNALLDGGEDTAEVHGNFALAYEKGNDKGLARQHYLKALELDPDHESTLINFSLFLQALKEFEQAEELAQKALKLYPDNAIAHNTVGNLHRSKGELAAAERSYRSAIGVDDQRSDLYSNLGIALGEQGKYQGMESAFVKALLLDPDYLDAKINLASYHIRRGYMAKARVLLEEVLEVEPENENALINYGRLLSDAGEFAAAESVFNRAVDENPKGLAQISSLAAIQVYRDDVTDEELLAVHKKSGDAITQISSYIAEEAESDPSGLNSDGIKVGFVSSDLHEHSVAYFFEPLIESLDKQKFDTYCYSNSHVCDAVSERLKTQAKNWVDIAGWSSESVSKKIREDKIDILVDLNGYTAGGRYEVFAARAAPVQVSWLGYAHSTGMINMDYRIVDSITDPEGAALNSEALTRLDDCFLCYLPSADAPDVSAPPVMEKGYVQFGSFNNATKLSPTCLSLWAKVLNAIPDSRLIVKSHHYEDQEAQSQLAAFFESKGIDSSRVEARPRTDSLEGHFAAYSEIDIALDSYPYNGTTTTCEALWMGVPVLSMSDTRHASRVGRSLLNCVGLREFAVESEEAFVEKALALAASVDDLQALRASMRQRLLDSPLLDKQGFAKKVESAFERMLEAAATA